MNNLIRIIEQFKDKKILVLGDVMLDKYIWGEVSRISPEAPVQVVNVVKESYAPGGAANVANNIAALNAKSFMVGVVGKDLTKNQLIGELEKRNIDVSGLIEDGNKRTIRKVRVFGRNQQLLRFDYEKKGYVDAKTENNIFNFVSKILDKIDAIIISDYAKGTITKNLMDKFIELCNEKNKIIIVDPKPKHKEFYKNEIKSDKIFIEKMKDSNELEKFAREKYFLKKENEDIYIIEDMDSLKNRKSNE